MLIYILPKPLLCLQDVCAFIIFCLFGTLWLFLGFHPVLGAFILVFSLLSFLFSYGLSWPHFDTVSQLLSFSPLTHSCSGRKAICILFT